MMRRGLAAVRLAVCLLAAGCGSKVTPDGACGSSQGIVSLSWSIDGQAPGMGCRDVVNLTLELDYGCGSILIEPVPCALDHVRYDHLPEGTATVSLTGSSASGRISGSGTVEVTGAVPASPTVISLQFR
jgi:hypothetical protein